MKKTLALLKYFLVPLYLLNLFIIANLLLIISSCSKFEDIVPVEGYDWPLQERTYWPTDGWEFASLEDHNIDPIKIGIADQFAKNDELSRALVVVKDGYIVFEKYYHGGGIDHSTNLHSVTKSFSSALIGFMIDDGTVSSTDQLLATILPDYPEFKDVTLHHALTHTTGLSWTEEGILWENWVASDDWVAEALARGFEASPGKQFKYSSANSHFLTSLVYYTTGIFPGQIAKERLFDPLGIPFDVFNESVVYNRWSDYVKPLSQSWRKDTKGVEIAATCLYLTARDMAKFGYLYLNRGKWDNTQILSQEWISASTHEHSKDIYERYSYGYQWWITFVDRQPVFLASGLGGQIIGVVPSLDLVVVLKYDAENPVHPDSGTGHDDMHLFELVVESVFK
jgi:CubicO group peptidase (beta-lactamase class C family)